MCVRAEFHPTPSAVGQGVAGVPFLLFHSGPVGESPVESGPESSEGTVSPEEIGFRLTSESLHDARCPASSQRPIPNCDFLHNCDLDCFLARP